MPDTLALVSVIAFACGILAAGAFPFSWPFLAFLLLLSAGFSVAWFLGRRDGYLLPTVLLLCFALGSARLLLAPSALPLPLVPLVGTPVTLTGTISGDPDVRETNQRLTLMVARDGVRTKVLVVAERYPAYSCGDEVTVSGTLERPQPFDTDGGRTFAYDTFLAKDGIFAMLPHARVAKVGESHAPLVVLERILYGAKHAFTRALENALPEPHASLAEGLLAGGKQGLGKALLDAFTIAGLLPIIVLSGYNVMIVAEAVLAGLSFLPKRFSLVLAAFTIVLFVAAAGGGASALRAGVMAVLALFARATRRTYDALRVLLLVFVLMLLINPLELASDPGFQFSFVATLGLIVASSAFEVRLMKIRWPLLREVVATTLAAQLFVLPLLLYQTGNLSLVAIPANILVLPVVPLTMALSAIAGLVSLLVPLVAIYAGLPAYLLLSYITGVATVAAGLPLAHVIVPAFPVALLALPYAGIAWFVLRLGNAQSKMLTR
ncbi:MAG: Competence protein ComEC [Parcubacteria group bacterium]|nr:Competence protein ComEC [Parcubacteria group bacterium]